MTLRKAFGVACVAVWAVAGAGCDVFDDLDDRFKTCDDTIVTLTNDPQTRETVSIIGPGEVFGDQAVLVSGHSREIGLCLQRGDRKEFRVMRDGREIAAVNCVASLASYDTVRPEVVWIKNTIRCDGW
jgi:hypothetical protein